MNADNLRPIVQATCRAKGLALAVLLVPLGLVPAALAQDYSEAPILAEQVAAGELPAVADRLPDEPFVVGPGVIVLEENLDWEPGQYGGTLRTAHSIPEVNNDVIIMLNEHLFMAPGISVDGIRPNILRAFEANEDNTFFTFHLREGLKWSDGVPVTTEDIRFMYEDVYLNEELTPSFPAKFRTGGSPTGDIVDLQIVDDYTFTMAFTEPYGSLLSELTIKGWSGYTDIMQPAHHLKQFHIDYTSLDEMRADLNAANLGDEWWTLFTAKNCDNWSLTLAKCIGFPALYPWLRVESGAPGIMQFARNPYYFKVDTTGQQLPYIDEVISVLVEDTDMVNLNVLTGDVDLLREATALLKLPLYKENEESGGFQVGLLDNHVTPAALFLNYTFEDPVWREVVGNLEFRRALNLSINRQEIIDNIYFGLAELPQHVPGDYDVEEANRILDSIGMDQRDGNGFRLSPSGEPFTIRLAAANFNPDTLPVSELLVEHFKVIGIDATMNVMDSGAAFELYDTNKAAAFVIHSATPLWADNLWNDYMPGWRWAKAWQVWHDTAGAEGEEPAAFVQRIYELAEGRIGALPGSDEDKALYAEIRQIHYDNLIFLNVAEQVRYALVTNADLGNVPHAGQAIGGNNSGEQFFYRTPQ